ncbi:MAG: 2,3,4,5-tetrahydropyridine-2,6-dicarboxylate N-succinyltransferase [Bradymonadia bacterium]
MDPRQAIIEEAAAHPEKREAAREAVFSVLDDLDRGALRVAEPGEGDDWIIHEWIRRAILLYFALSPMEIMEAPPFEFRDRIRPKQNLEAAGVRVVPPGVARYGSHLEPGVILMPGYVNIGARVGAGTLVDTWATVGSCAQIGAGVHLSGGVGIGGVLEPPGASPVIIEDHAFIGSRCVVVEGVRVGKGAVLGANTILTKTTPIIDVTGEAEVIHKGRVPAGSVVIPGVRPRQFPAGTYHLPCALIIGHRTESTDQKTSLNDALRRFDVPV